MRLASEVGVSELGCSRGMTSIANLSIDSTQASCASVMKLKVPRMCCAPVTSLSSRRRAAQWSGPPIFLRCAARPSR